MVGNFGACLYSQKLGEKRRFTSSRPAWTTWLSIVPTTSHQSIVFLNLGLYVAYISFSIKEVSNFTSEEKVHRVNLPHSHGDQSSDPGHPDVYSGHLVIPALRRQTGNFSEPAGKLDYPN